MDEKDLFKELFEDAVKVFIDKYPDKSSQERQIKLMIVNTYEVT